MIGHKALPSITSWPTQYDPKGTGWSMFPITVTENTYGITDEEIKRYMCPYIEAKHSEVIGIYTSGRDTKNKMYLPQIYARARITMRCHSCGRELSPKVVGRYSIDTHIGDHQPPTTLFEVVPIINNGLSGKYRYIIEKINSLRLPLYNFTCTVFDEAINGPRTYSFQTSSIRIAEELGESIERVEYKVGDTQYLYPHCKQCSDKQGELLF